MIYNVGSINIDYVYRVSHLVQPGETLASSSFLRLLGGKGANQSVAIAKAGAQVAHVGRVGKTDQWALTQMSEFGVNVGSVETSDEPSGHAIIQVDEAGENSIVLFGGANQQQTPEQLSRALGAAGPEDWFLIQNECNALSEVFNLAAAKNIPVAFNPAPMSGEAMELPLSQARCLILNEIEASAITDSDGRANSRADSQGGTAKIDGMVRALVERFPNSLVALTLGAAGVKLIDQGQVSAIASPSVKAVDTTGAGDTFVGYFLAGLVDGQSSADAASMACHAAALSVTVEGATPSIPSKAELLKFMNASLGWTG